MVPQCSSVRPVLPEPADTGRVVRHRIRTKPGYVLHRVFDAKIVSRAGHVSVAGLLAIAVDRVTQAIVDGLRIEKRLDKGRAVSDRERTRLMPSMVGVPLPGRSRGQNP